MDTIDKIIHDGLVQYYKRALTAQFRIPERRLERSVNELMQSLIDAKESGIITDYEIKDGAIHITHHNRQ